MSADPTVARLVLYHPGPEDLKLHNADGRPLAAVVCYVQGVDTVNLFVLSEVCVGNVRLNVKLVQAGDPVPATSYCEYAPAA